MDNLHTPRRPECTPYPQEDFLKLSIQIYYKFIYIRNDTGRNLDTQFIYKPYWQETLYSFIYQPYW